jgi:hypothetical protein
MSITKQLPDNKSNIVEYVQDTLFTMANKSTLVRDSNTLIMHGWMNPLSDEYVLYAQAYGPGIEEVSYITSDKKSKTSRDLYVGLVDGLAYRGSCKNWGLQQFSLTKPPGSTITRAEYYQSTTMDED